VCQATAPHTCSNCVQDLAPVLRPARPLGSVPQRCTLPSLYGMESRKLFRSRQRATATAGSEAARTQQLFHLLVRSCRSSLLQICEEKKRHIWKKIMMQRVCVDCLFLRSPSRVPYRTELRLIHSAPKGRRTSVRSTSDGRGPGPVTRKRVPDREEPGRPRKDARRGRCHPLKQVFGPCG
jgi:hypothetical protein